MRIVFGAICIWYVIPTFCIIDTSLNSVSNPLTTDYYSRKKNRCLHDAKEVISESLTTIVTLHTNLISWDTFRLITATMPFFIASRMHDKKLQGCFYCPAHHKNKDQFPYICFKLADYGIGIPIMLLASYALYGRTEESRKMGRTFLIAMPFVIFGKDILKMLSFDFCKRPWNEKFSCKKQAHGGFPSGHMAQAVYMASFFGMEYGPSHAVPLGIFAGFVGLTFINCNRHYLSQIVAGAVWGGMFAISSHKIIEKYRARTNNIDIGVGMNDYGGAAMSLSYKF